MATHSSVLAWRIPGTGEPAVYGVVQSQTLFFGAPKSLQMVIAAMNLNKTLALWKKSYEQPRQHIKKQRHYFANKGLSKSKLWFY